MDSHCSRDDSGSGARVGCSAMVGILLAVWSALAGAQVVGRTSGVAAVTADGSATYAIPLWTPPGAGGLKPSLELLYSQGIQNGLLGVGWTVSGLPLITRCYKTIAQDCCARHLMRA